MTTVGRRPPVPIRALAVSVGSLAVPVLATFLIPDWTEDQLGMLVWLTALVPAFMLAYYRGLKGVAIALAGGMALLSTTQVVVLVLGVTNPNWALLLGVVVLYLGISIGIAIFAEMLHRQRREAEALALVDRLTGLPNRRCAEFTLESEFAAAARGRTLGVVLFDLDHFKQVNDGYGHAAGDKTLKAFAEVLKANTRRMNLSARFGGEEFISVLADTSVKAAVNFATRVRDGIKHREFPWGRVTVSGGIAGFEHGMGSYEVLVAAADRALYAAKQAGRDRIEIAREFAPEQKRISYSALRRPLEGPSGPTVQERVLVVDDDPDVRRSVVRILNRAGYQTEDADAPDRVIARYQAGAPDIDLVIMDVMMPKMNGLTLVDRISAFAPDVRVVYMSGYIHGEVSWAGLPGSIVGFVEKPVDLERLLATVRTVLDDPSSPGANAAPNPT